MRGALPLCEPFASELGDDALRARGDLGLHLLEVDTRANAVAIDHLTVAHGEHDIGAMA